MIGKLKNFFGGGPSSASSSTDSSAPSPVSDDNGTTVTPSSSAAPEPSTPATKEGNNVVPLVWEISHLSIRPLTALEIQKSRQR